MNPKLIKQDIDGNEYSNSCPTIGALMIAHYSTPQAHRADIYEADRLFFSVHPGRRMYLRPAFAWEFDVEESETQSQERPTLWVRVLQISSGFHEILPVWRGRAFWNGPQSDSDEGCGIVCLNCALHGGVNLSDWSAYISDARTRNADEAFLAKHKNNTRIN
jgi:hypothetical protein